jgi:hypothetical protein
MNTDGTALGSMTCSPNNANGTHIMEAMMTMRDVA